LSFSRSSFWRLPVRPKTAGFNGFELADKTGKFLRKPADYRDYY
jgi:hypothetical protein